MVVRLKSQAQAELETTKTSSAVVNFTSTLNNEQRE